MQLKLAVERTKMLQEKKEAIAKKDRKEISNLIGRHKEESARIKVEGIIAEDVRRQRRYRSERVHSRKLTLSPPIRRFTLNYWRF